MGAATAQEVVSLKFPTNPINALEASRGALQIRQGSILGFQLIQLTHWKRGDRKFIIRPEGVFLFPTNPINALEARGGRVRAGFVCGGGVSN